MKMTVGLLLTSFGTFWLGEGAGLAWPGSDLAILALFGFYSLITSGTIWACGESSLRAGAGGGVMRFVGHSHASGGTSSSEIPRRSRWALS